MTDADFNQCRTKIVLPDQPVLKLGDQRQVYTLVHFRFFFFVYEVLQQYKTAQPYSSSNTVSLLLPITVHVPYASSKHFFS